MCLLRGSEPGDRIDLCGSERLSRLRNFLPTHMVFVAMPMLSHPDMIVQLCGRLLIGEGFTTVARAGLLKPGLAKDKKVLKPPS